ncbi:Metallopeptidase family M24 [Aspergillus sp. HF37]|nr:Metallopeptidase family M24 [Aspergillus sp. HF37]
MSKDSFPKHYLPPQSDSSRCARRTIHLALVLALLVGYYVYQSPPTLKPLYSKLEAFQQCSIDNLLGTGLYFLDSASPVAVADFQERRDRLANALVADGVDAFVVEPGYTFKYYANVSQQEWEPWEPEERPFLMIVQPLQDQDSGQITANTSFLCPSFEAERARLLDMPFPYPIQIIPWEEHWDPYATLMESQAVPGRTHSPILMVDEEMRDFIQRGLGSAGFDIVGLSGHAEQARQVKSEKEVGILRAVNTGTVEAVRQVRKCLYPGLLESEIADVLDNTMRAVGLEPFFDLVFFDENAANPHGGTNGTTVLEPETLVLIDVGSVWDVVFEAQTQSIHQMRENSTAASVDIAAREVIDNAGYGDTFTHRLGHGIGIKAHESPYLNKGNFKSLLKAGMTFTSEPGVYLIGRFGVRHEDVLLVQEDADPILLTGARAGGPWDP